MEYIKCTHCSKRYGVNDKIREAAGRAIRCKACNEAFPIIIYGDESAEEDLSVINKGGGWDPSFTMPPTEAQDLTRQGAAKKKHAGEKVGIDAFVQNKKKKKRRQLQFASGLAVCSILAVGLFFWLGDSPNLATQVANIQDSAANKAKQAELSKLGDKDRPECRKAAAAQWLIDSRIMHENYEVEEYIVLLRRSQLQSAQVRGLCRDDNIIQHILKAATTKHRPAWFADELKKALP